MNPAASGSYIHGTEPAEQQRLAALNRMTNAPFVRFLGVTRGARVLEVGSGLGILAADVASAAEGVRVVGVEKSPEQIAAAVGLPGVTYVRGDAQRLEFPDGSFDLVYARYLLEHVADPEQVLREMRRVTRPGGRVAACENDISLLRIDPPCPAFEEVWAAFQRLQDSLGGDGRIGRRLFRLFRNAGFSKVELSVQPEVHWFGSPGFSSWIRNVIGNIESARDGMMTSGFSDAIRIEKAIAELSELFQRDDASATFAWNRALAIR
ncbi:MAG TPA: methyltransferase domain-containing protein [Vicinamibacterales bacterium]|jgi:SAM-dependent methyltransferase|nr:methyltransferase domain-containing protein [Vicinamibacterales bacterium]